jgi:hypothetical protein
MQTIRGWALALGVLASAPSLALTLTVAIEQLT